MAILTLADSFLPDDGVPTLVLKTHLPAGHVLTAGDLTTVEFSPAIPGSYDSQSAPLGETLAVGLPAGAPLTSGMLLGPSLADSAPSGTIVVTIQLADPGSLALARPGSRVQLVGDTAHSAGSVLASEVLVLARIDAPGGGGLLGSTETPPYAVVAIPQRAATLVLQSSATAPLRVALHQE